MNLIAPLSALASAYQLLQCKAIQNLVNGGVCGLDTGSSSFLSLSYDLGFQVRGDPRDISPFAAQFIQGVKNPSLAGSALVCLDRQVAH